jgi:hypothetical protein
MCRLQVVGDRLLLVNSDVSRVSSDVALVEDAARELIKLFVFQGSEQASSNLGGGGDVIERDMSQLPLATQPFAEYAHLSLGLFQRFAQFALPGPSPIIESGADTVKLARLADGPTHLLKMSG